MYNPQRLPGNVYTEESCYVKHPAFLHMDAGWYGPEMKMSSDATTVSPDKDLDIPALFARTEYFSRFNPGSISQFASRIQIQDNIIVVNQIDRTFAVLILT